jgi:hypothetical protein
MMTLLRIPPVAIVGNAIPPIVNVVMNYIPIVGIIGMVRVDTNYYRQE